MASQNDIVSQKVLVASGPGKLELRRNFPIPALDDDQVLVKIHAVALNLADWKTLDNPIFPPGIHGCDFARTITQKIGKSVRADLKQGDRVAGFLMQADPHYPNNGAFAEYVAAVGDLLIKIPESMSYTQAATLPTGTT